jgi:hypothetical protein
LQKHILHQGTLKWEVSLYCWPPLWLVWNQLYDNWQFSFLFAKQTNPNKSNRRSTVQWYFLFKCSLIAPMIATWQQNLAAEFILIGDTVFSRIEWMKSRIFFAYLFEIYQCTSHDNDNFNNDDKINSFIIFPRNRMFLSFLWLVG